ncbi:MAG: hypothetical protein ACUVQ0_01970 [Thermoproteota archaeon]
MESIILTHGDCEGICAGAIVLSATKASRMMFTNPANLLSDLRTIESGHIFITDIALTPRHINEIVAEFRRISRSGEVIYLDRHPLPEDFKASRIFAKTLKKGAHAPQSLPTTTSGWSSTRTSAG